uniref:Uncharacterized protein n=1 Tax=Oryza punctata TaxID=4537 RepID=A0A0E0JT37_ORYPU
MAAATGDDEDVEEIQGHRSLPFPKFYPPPPVSSDLEGLWRVHRHRSGGGGGGWQDSAWSWRAAVTHSSFVHLRSPTLTMEGDGMLVNSALDPAVRQLQMPWREEGHHAGSGGRIGSTRSCHGKLNQVVVVAGWG